jgi:hypothetical protein
MSYEEEDTCMPYEEEDAQNTSMYTFVRIHMNALEYDLSLYTLAQQLGPIETAVQIKSWFFNWVSTVDGSPNQKLGFNRKTRRTAAGKRLAAKSVIGRAAEE